MKKLIVVALITVFAAAAAFSQKKSEPFEKTNAEAQKIVKYMDEWANLSNKHEVGALDKMLSDDLVITFQDGEVVTKTEYIASLKANLADFVITYHDQKVDLFNDKTAVLRARYVVKVGKDVTVEFRTTVTFLKRKGNWDAVAFHSSPLVKK